MIEAITKLLNTLLPMVYALSVAAYALEFFRGEAWAGRLAHRLTASLLGLHVTYLAFLTARLAHLPLASSAELMTTIAFAVTATYLFVERRSGTTHTGVFVIAFGFALQTLSSTFITPDAALPEVLRSPLFALHTVTAVVGYTGFAVSAIYGGLYLLLYWELKRSRFGLVYDRLPPLEDLARMSMRASLIGVASLTVTIACGSLWASVEFPGFVRDPKFLFTILVWALYALAAWLHFARDWSGRRSIRIALFGFAAMLLGGASRLFFQSFHDFK